MVALGDAGNLIHRRFDGTDWSNWRDLGGQLQGEPAILAGSPDRVDIAVRGTNGNVMAIARDGTVWTDWVSLEGKLGGDPARCGTTWDCTSTRAEPTVRSCSVRSPVRLGSLAGPRRRPRLHRRTTRDPDLRAGATRHRRSRPTPIRRRSRPAVWRCVCPAPPTRWTASAS